MHYKSTDWSLDTAEGWMSEDGNSCTTFVHPSGVGALQVSSYRKDGVVTDAELHEFAGYLPLVAMTIGQLNGFSARFSDGDTFWLKWWLRFDNQMIHATYNCPLVEGDREVRAVNSMILSLSPTGRDN